MVAIATAKKTTTKKTVAKTTRKVWTAATLRIQIKKWLKEIDTPINKEEINHYKKVDPKKYIKPEYKVPTKASFNKYISKNTIKEWGSGNEKQRDLYKIYQDEVVDVIEDRLTQRAMGGSNKGAAGAMFLLKATYGYSEYGNNKEEAPVIINIKTGNDGDNKI